jgi:hypothetical protein
MLPGRKKIPGRENKICKSPEDGMLGALPQYNLKIHCVTFLMLTVLLDC